MILQYPFWMIKSITENRKFLNNFYIDNECILQIEDLLKIFVFLWSELE